MPWSGAPPGVDFFVTSEMALTGYPARDLLLQHAFIDRAGETAQVAGHAAGGAPPVLVGLPLKIRPVRDGRCSTPPLCSGGRVARHFDKSLLPTYDVFDEDRYFEPGDGLQVSRSAGAGGGQRLRRRLERPRLLAAGRATTSIRSTDVRRLGADVLLNLSASPFSVGKQRRARGDARRARAPARRCSSST